MQHPTEPIAATWPPPPSFVPEPVAAVDPKRGLAVAAMVLGITGAVLALVPILGLIGILLGILAVIFGVVGRRQSKAMARTGLFTGIAAIVIGIIGLVIVVNATNDLSDNLSCIDRANTSAEVRACR